MLVADPHAPREARVSAGPAAALPDVPVRDLLIGEAPRGLRVDPEIAARVCAFRRDGLRSRCGERWERRRNPERPVEGEAPIAEDEGPDASGASLGLRHASPGGRAWRLTRWICSIQACDGKGGAH